MSRIVVVLVVLVAALPVAGQDLGQDSLDRWLAYIRPDAEELRWQNVPWRAALSDAVVEARRRDLPILLWAMNGHPLACV